MNAIAERPESEVVLVQADRRPPMPPSVDPEPLPIAEIRACPNLSAALALACDRCKMAAKDGWNDYHKFKYASADGVIETAKEALAGSGLAIIPHKQKMNILAAGNTAIYALDRTIFLSHSSGEFVPLTVEGWPVIPEKGRPLDKAFAVALTTSMAYLLRDLLRMPRGDEAEVNARDDTQAKPTPKPETVGKASPDLVTLRNDLGKLIRDVAAARGTEPDHVYSKLRESMFHKFPNLPDTTSGWERPELLWAIETAKNALAKPVPAQVEQEPNEREPSPDEVAWMQARDRALDVMKSARITWQDVLKDSARMIGRVLPGKALAKDLSTEEFDKLTAYCEAVRKAKQPVKAM